MIAYRQRDYPDIAYPSRADPDATVRTGGCGPVALSILLANLAGITLAPAAAALYAMRCGARVSGGTDMSLLGANAARDYGLRRVRTDDTETLLRALRKGAAAIVNVGGDRTGHRGILSAGGHYLVALGAAGSTVILVDPGMYPGKYLAPYRAEKTALLGEAITVSAETLASDCENRSPRYHIFTKE